LEKSQLNSHKEKQIKPLDEQKLQKYVYYLLRCCQIEYSLTLMDVCEVLVEKSRELKIKNMNPFVFFFHKKPFALIFSSENLF